MKRQVSNISRKLKSLFTVEENAIFDLLQHIGNSADEFDDPENGDYLDHLELMFRNADQLDSLVVKIALDRTHYFLDSWERSFFYEGSYETIPHPYPDVSRFKLPLEATDLTDSTGVKRLLLEYIEMLQMEYFWGECCTPDSSMISSLSEIIKENKLNEPIVLDFIRFNILEPWCEFLDVDDYDDADDLESWLEECRKF